MAFNPFQNTNAVAATIADASTGNAAFTIPETNVYKATMLYAYMEQSAKEQNTYNIIIRWKLEQGYTFNETLWSVVKQGSVFSGTNKDGTKKMTYGFQVATRYFATFVGKSLEQAFENMSTKTVDVYDFGLRTDVPKQINCFTDSINAQGYVAFQRKVSNKQEKQGDVYVATAERKTEPTIAFTTTLDKRTLSELKIATAPTKLDAWQAANAGKDYDAYKPVANVAAANTAVSANTFNFS